MKLLYNHTMTIYYVYLKTHSMTGLKYLGQTSKDPVKYKGSGTDWLRHLKTFGNSVVTEILFTTTSLEERNHYGRMISAKLLVVSAMDDFGNKIYANRIPETGGGYMTSQRALEIQNRPDVVKKRKDRWNNEQFKTTHRNSIAGVPKSIEHKQSISKTLTGNTPWNKNIKGYENKNKRNDAVFHFIHMNGDEEFSTMYEMCSKHSLSQGNLSNVVYGRRKHTKGWFINKNSHPEIFIE